MTNPALAALADLVDELLERVEEREDVTYAPWREAVEAVAQRARHAALNRHALTRSQAGPTPPPTVVQAATPRRLPKARPRRILVRAPGLLAQLADIADHTITASGEPSTRSTPDSAAPPGGGVVELAATLEADILGTLRKVAPDGPRRRTAAGALRALVGLAPDLDEHDLDAVVRAARSWVHTARVALSWDVPVVALPDSWCPSCEGHHTLRVRQDASSDVWCAGRLIGPPRLPADTDWPGVRIHAGPIDVDPDHIHRCPARWPRNRWVLVLDDMLRRRREADEAARIALEEQARTELDEDDEQDPTDPDPGLPAAS